jgi:DNA-binding transcriptional LysR family regulator
LADLEETEQAVSDMHAAPRGELRVNATPTFGILQLAPAMADFTTRFPAISVELMLSEHVLRVFECAAVGKIVPSSEPRPALTRLWHDPQIGFRGFPAARIALPGLIVGNRARDDHVSPSFLPS